MSVFGNSHWQVTVRPDIHVQNVCTSIVYISYARIHHNHMRIKTRQGEKTEKRCERANKIRARTSRRNAAGRAAGGAVDVCTRRGCDCGGRLVVYRLLRRCILLHLRDTPEPSRWLTAQLFTADRRGAVAESEFSITVQLPRSQLPAGSRPGPPFPRPSTAANSSTRETGEKIPRRPNPVIN